ncbi:hypothetical protein HMPREF0322_00359 [Desulfitobacterium hafniense DP7]|uniref:Uncharacterized protein n=1 Tax=Desulfitobacterium hafniense DP7 TaxID=537010 RepID=G9XHD5_DESHA|nr:hypothetical protein HMPREF0322_00359 [Desulfitobacterium hafniense DP7]
MFLDDKVIDGNFLNSHKKGIIALSYSSLNTIHNSLFEGACFIDPKNNSQ